MPTRPYEIKFFPTDAALAQAAAETWVEAVAKARAQNTTYTVALSGGRIAKNFFTLVAALAQQRAVSFDHVHFFWADERCVPPTDPESNFLLAQTHLLAPLQIPAKNIHRLRGEIAPADAVAAADAEIQVFAAKNAEDFPVLDLVILGMGEDGHIASMFPNTLPFMTNVQTPFVAVDNSPKPPPQRLSLTFAAMAAARAVWVLASGSGKAAALKESLAPAGPTPLARVLRERQSTLVWTDIAGI